MPTAWELRKFQLVSVNEQVLKCLYRTFVENHKNSVVQIDRKIKIWSWWCDSVRLHKMFFVSANNWHVSVNLRRKLWQFYSEWSHREVKNCRRIKKVIACSRPPRVVLRSKVKNLIFSWAINFFSQKVPKYHRRQIPIAWGLFSF